MIDYRQAETSAGIFRMYLRPVFAEEDPARIAGLIRAHPFGLLVTQRDGAMEGSHVPFVIEERTKAEGPELVLAAHLGAANAQVAALDGGTGLAVFSGPHAYIAPGWYRTQPAVPTWDYAAVHVHGRLERVDDEAGVSAILRALAAGDPAGFDLDALEPRYRAQMFKGIVAFRLHPTRIEAQWKMSQNRSAEDRRGVIAALRGQGEDAVAELIAATLPAG
jgi:transcriptional regulator